jgi:hypothetical protein
MTPLNENAPPGFAEVANWPSQVMAERPAASLPLINATPFCTSATLIRIASADEVKPITENNPMAKPKNLFMRVSSCWLMVSLSLLLPINQRQEEQERI